MTRDQAIAALIKSKEQWGGGSSEAWLVNSLEAIGMLKLDEPKSQDDRLAAVVMSTFSFDTNTKEMTLFRKELEAAGLKIVEEKP
jgi:hypothetical protein